jgi:hypothetical protein
MKKKKKKKEDNFNQEADQQQLSKQKRAIEESSVRDEDEQQKDFVASKADDRVWVQCNTCDKWRALPCTVDTAALPDIWVCSLNVYDFGRNRCDAPEESYEEDDIKLKSFIKLWTKRLRNADRCESKSSSTSSIAAKLKKRKVDCDWIQCSDINCGKWRAVSRGVDIALMLKRMDRGLVKRGGWACSMNNWDETTASCAAPQEPLWDCRWNLACDNEDL